MLATLFFSCQNSSSILVLFRGREGSGGGAAVTTQTPGVRNKLVKKAVEKWDPPVKAPKHNKKKLNVQGVKHVLYL
jgi:hypothetical protein